MLLSELTTKDVIDDHDGTKMGKINDLEIDSTTGKINNIKVNNGFRLSNLIGNKNNLSIPWHKIIKIGSDVIIIESSIIPKNH